MYRITIIGGARAAAKTPFAIVRKKGYKGESGSFDGKLHLGEEFRLGHL